MIDGAHIAFFAHFTAVVSKILACFVQLVKSEDEKASKKTCFS